MNDHDIQLIAALVEGQLPAAEQQAARARAETDAEFRAAYEEQLAMASLLGDAPPAALTAVESESLRAALRSQLRLEEEVVVAAPAGSWWTRWWAPLTGLATAAAVVLAFVIVPNLGGEDASDDLAATAAETTVAPSLAADPLAGTSESAESEGAAADGAEGAPTTTAAAGGELFQAEAQTYALGPTPEGPDMDLPVVDEDALDPVGLSSALTRAATVPVDLDAVRACFPDVPAEAGALMFILTAVTPDGVIVGTVTDPDTGAQLTLTIDLTTCTVTSAG